MKKHDDTGAEVVVGCVAILAFIATIILLGGLVFWIAWNVGVVALVAAAGGSVGKISFWAAVGGSLAVGILSRIFTRSVVTTK